MPDADWTDAADAAWTAYRAGLITETEAAEAVLKAVAPVPMLIVTTGDARDLVRSDVRPSERVAGEQVDVDLSALFDAPQIHTDDGVHRDAAGWEYRLVEVAGEVTYVAEGGEGER